MTVVCFVNQKGGVGKTASVVNIGVGLAKFRKRVLMIDLDPQESLSYWLGINDPPKTIYDFFDGRESLQDCTVKHESGVDIVPSSEMLATLTPDINKFRDALIGQKYDYVLLDCSPTLGMTTLAALTAADWVIIPLFPDLLSLKGMSQLLGTINTIREETNPNLVLKGIIATRYSAHKKMHVDVLGQIREAFPDISVFTVRESIAVSESPVEGKSVLDYRPNSNGAKDYYYIAKKLVNTKYKSAASTMLAQHALGANQDNALRQQAAVIEQADAPPQLQDSAVIGEKIPETVVNDADKPSEGETQEVQAEPQGTQAEEPAAEPQLPSEPAGFSQEADPQAAPLNRINKEASRVRKSSSAFSLRRILTVILLAAVGCAVMIYLVPLPSWTPPWVLPWVKLYGLIPVKAAVGAIVGGVAGLFVSIFVK